MPSATMNSEPLSPARCARTLGWSDASFVLRSATTNASSLCSRVRPTSVRPNTWTRISLWSGWFTGSLRRGEVEVTMSARRYGKNSLDPFFVPGSNRRALHVPHVPARLSLVLPHDVCFVAKQRREDILIGCHSGAWAQGIDALQ